MINLKNLDFQDFQDDGKHKDLNFKDFQLLLSFMNIISIKLQWNCELFQSFHLVSNDAMNARDLMLSTFSVFQVKYFRLSFTFNALAKSFAPFFPI